MANDGGSKLVWIGTRIERDRADQLAEIAREEDRSVASVIRRTVDQIIDARENAKEAA